MQNVSPADTMDDRANGVAITLKLFGGFRRHLPAESEGHACEIEVPRGSTPGHVLAHFHISTEGAVVLINGLTAGLDCPLEAGDVLAAFPSLAGG